MRYPQQQKQITRERIVCEAGKLFRRHGYAAVGVDSVMKAAGLTPGGFYAHFANKEALFAEALTVCSLERSTLQQLGTASPLENLIRNYLSEDHLLHPESGCPLPPLGSEVSRQSSKLRHAYGEALRAGLDKIAVLLPHKDPAIRLANAFVLLSSMAGAVLTARSLDNPQLAVQLLKTAREALLKEWVSIPRRKPPASKRPVRHSR